MTQSRMPETTYQQNYGNSSQTAYEVANVVRERIDRMQDILSNAGFSLDRDAALTMMAKGQIAEAFSEMPHNMNVEQRTRLGHTLSHYQTLKLQEPGIWLRVDKNNQPDPGTKAPKTLRTPAHHPSSDMAPLIVAERCQIQHPGIEHLKAYLTSDKQRDINANAAWRTICGACQDDTGEVGLWRDDNRSRAKRYTSDVQNKYNQHMILFEVALTRDKHYNHRAIIRPRFADCVAGPRGEVALWRTATDPTLSPGDTLVEEVMRGFTYGIGQLASASGEDAKPFINATKMHNRPTKIDRFRWAWNEAFELRNALKRVHRTPHQLPEAAEVYCPFTKTTVEMAIYRLPQKWQRFIFRWQPKTKQVKSDARMSPSSRHGHWALQFSAGNGIRTITGNAIVADHNRETNEYIVQFGPKVPDFVKEAILDNPAHLLMSRNEDGSMNLHGLPNPALPPLDIVGSPSSPPKVRAATDDERYRGPATARLHASF